MSTSCNKLKTGAKNGMGKTDCVKELCVIELCVKEFCVKVLCVSRNGCV